MLEPKTWFDEGYSITSTCSLNVMVFFLEDYLPYIEFWIHTLAKMPSISWWIYGTRYIRDYRTDVKLYSL